MGSQDQIATAYGGFNHIKFLTNGKFKVTKFKNEEFIKKLNQNLVLIIPVFKEQLQMLRLNI